MSFNDEKWNVIHGPLKSMVRTMLTGSRYLLREHIITKKEDLKSNELKRLWSAWDIAFDNWSEELELPNYREREIYKILVDGRNLVSTIIDNDGPYLKLLYQMISAWEKVKEDDRYLR